MAGSPVDFAAGPRRVLAGRRGVLRGGFTALLVAGGMASGRHLHAQPEWPHKPIQLFVSYGAGGAVDVVCRLLAEPLTQILGQPFVILNRPGGNANIAPGLVLQAPADGYSLLASSTATVINPVVDRKLGWNRDSFAPIVRFAQASNLIVVPAASGTKTLAEFIARAKAHPGLTTPVTGFGSSQAVARESFARAAGIRLLDVHYKGGVSFLPDLLSGQLAMSVSPLNVVMRLVKDGQLIALANTGERRSPLLPDVPTMIELGYPAATSISWFGFHAAAATPPAVLAKLAQATQRALADPQLQSKLNALGMEPAFQDTATFRLFIDAETQKAERYVLTLPPNN